MMTKNEFKELRRKRQLNLGTYIKVTQPCRSGLERGRKYKITGISSFDSDDCYVTVGEHDTKLTPSQFKKA